MLPLIATSSLAMTLYAVLRHVLPWPLAFYASAERPDQHQ